MELRNRFLGFVRTRHRHESESTGFAREFVLHEGRFGHGSNCGEVVLKIHFGGIEGKISYVEFR